MNNGKDSFRLKNHQKQKRASLTSQSSQPVTDHPKRRETVAEYIRRGGTITAQSPVYDITRPEVKDLLDKIVCSPKEVDFCIK